VVLLAFWQEWAIPVAAISLITLSSFLKASLVSGGQVSRRALTDSDGSYAIRSYHLINEKDESKNDPGVK
jgi:hypothetical protein